jgi:hypothetical protein
LSSVFNDVIEDAEAPLLVGPRMIRLLIKVKENS